MPLSAPLRALSMSVRAPLAAPGSSEGAGCDEQLRAIWENGREPDLSHFQLTLIS